MMPIRPDMMALYPGSSIRSPEWREIRAEISDRSGGRCEGSDAYPDCRAVDGELHPITGAVVVLTVAHVDQDPANNGEPGRRPNLRHWCQLCHNTHDAPTRARNAQATLRGRLREGTPDLFAEEC